MLWIPEVICVETRRGGAVRRVPCARPVLKAACAQSHFSVPIPLPGRSCYCLHFTDEETGAQKCDDLLKVTKLTEQEWGLQSLSSSKDALAKERKCTPVSSSAFYH